mmetsp:Transcript_46087/g.152802  ORF Transcript_46087/g.152802 Transcript_46087/m.152802 type:complete len:123 (+) Transcript_46087:276-644(+)
MADLARKQAAHAAKLARDAPPPPPPPASASAAEGDAEGDAAAGRGASRTPDVAAAGPTAAGGAAQEEAARAERYAEPVMAVADGEVSAAAWCLAHAESDSAPFGEVSVATLPLSAAAARPPR